MLSKEDRVLRGYLDGARPRADGDASARHGGVPALDSLPGGGRLGEFRLVREIARGGMGVVYEAEQASLERRVALKVLYTGPHPDMRRIRRFLRESRAVGRLSHPAIVPVHTSGEAQGLLYFAMELIAGSDLERRIREGRLSPEEAARIAAEVAGGLAHAHRAGVIHRDVKPANILLDVDGRARIADFGLAFELADASIDQEALIGTPAYMAPEQARGEPATPSSDIYGLGACLYAMLAGGPPFPGNVSAVVLSQVRDGKPAPLATRQPSLPAELIGICEIAMCREPSQRHASADDLRDALHRFLRHDPLLTRTSRPELYTDTKPQPRGWRRKAAVLGLLLVGALTLFTFALLRERPRAVERVVAAPPTLPGHRLTAVDLPLQRYAYPSLSPDGSLLATAAETSVGWSLLTFEIATRRLSPLAVSGEPNRPAFSARGKELFQGDDTAARVFDLATGRATELSSGPHTHVSLSPDGRQIAFISAAPRLMRDIWGGGPLWVTALDHREPRLVTSMPVLLPDWSPDGKRIVFGSGNAKGASLWTVAESGGSLNRLTDNQSREWSPQWPNPGDWLYYAAERDGQMGIWRMPMSLIRGTRVGEPEPVPAGFLAGEFYLSVAASGSSLAIAGWGDFGHLYRAEINPDSAAITNPRRVLRAVRGIRQPVVSLDGNQVVYVPRDGTNLLLVDGSGRPPRELMEHGAAYASPSWSPDGASLAFQSDRSGSPDIWVLDFSQPKLRRITYTQGRGADHPVWSPDGQRLVYSVAGEGAFVISLGQVAAEPERLAATPDGAFASFIPTSWSPDGKRIVGVADGIVIYTVATREYARLTDRGEAPVWLADGRRLLFEDDDRIEVVDSQSLEKTTLFSASPSQIESQLSVDAGGTMLYFAADLSPETILTLDLEPEPHE